MHPPLDRPHPECMQEIDDLYHCHATTSKIKFWGCNNVKFALDQCLKKEKQNLLRELNKDAAAKRAAEEDAYQKALGKEMSFEDYLKKDKDYNKAMEERKRMEESKQKNWGPSWNGQDIIVLEASSYHLLHRNKSLVGTRGTIYIDVIKPQLQELSKQRHYYN